MTLLPATVRPFATLLIGLAFATSAAAQMARQVETDKTFGDYRVVYSAFNSSFVQPDVAAEHNITRGRNHGLVNIALIEGDSTTGRAAVVEGTVTDLMSRQRTLDFFEVREGDAVYYLAPFTFSHEDPLNFDVTVRTEPGGSAMPVSFRRTFYRD